MTAPASSGLLSTGLLPPSLAALLQEPVHRATEPAHQIGTTMIGSIFSAQPSAMPSLGVSGLQMQPYTASSGAVTSSAVAVSTSSAPAPVSVVAAATPLPPTPTPATDLATAFPPPYHFGNHITLKLTPDNYIFWRAQVLPLLRSHYLLGYVDGTLPCPPALVDGVHG
ncbi:hypothetical protein QYE76_000210 [Lolium multiflorum]|uniref:Retrotransposon Copia-like N-terminal domain-containing protein n=1 Tax=Lolium multiflorum TaxID=4521 RepID=A0AAD8RID5_LOLMU|nr:hypothetical protein QYE76_000210 [Lolium multiflorum]